MPSVDNRVVEMRFDNKDFETGVSESISSLDKLKKSLKMKDATDGFEELSEAADAVTQKFSVLGTIGDQVLRRIGDEIYNLSNKVVGLVKSMSFDQITVGMNKYEQKTESVQTILNATGKSLDEVNEQLERLMQYSDETSFGFTDMTQALQTMTSSGGKIEDLIPMIMGVGNATAYAGKGAAEFSRVMYNLNQSYGLGYLNTMDWKSLQLAGVGSKQLKETLLKVAEEQGKGNYALEQFSEALTKKVFDREVMQEAFGRFAKVTLEAERLVNEGMFENFTEAYAYLEKTDFAKLYDGIAFNAAKAAQEAKTFKEAIEATQDAVSTGWMTTFEWIFGNYKEAKTLWTWLVEELWDVFAGGAEARNEMLEEWHKAGGYEELWDGVKNIWYGLKSFGGRIKEGWLQIFPSLDANKLIDITHKFFEFSEKFRKALDPAFETIAKATDIFTRGKQTFVSIFGAGDVEIASYTLEEINEVLETGNELVDKYIRTLERLDELAHMVWMGDYGVGQERWNKLEEEGYAYELVQNLINEQAGVDARFAVDEEALTKAMSGKNDEIERTVEITEEATDTTEKMGKASKKTTNWISDLRDVLGGFKSALDLVVEAGKLAAKYIAIPAWNWLVETFKKVLAVIAPFSRAFSEFVTKLKESDFAERNIKAIRDWFSELSKYLKKQDNFQKFLEYLQDLKDWLHSIKEKTLTNFSEFLEKVLNWNIKLPDIETIGEKINTFIGWLNTGLEKLKEVKDFWPKVKAFFEGLDFSNVQSFAESAANGTVTFFKTLFESKDLKEASAGWFDQIWSGLKEKFKTVDWGEVIDILLKGLGVYTSTKFVLALSNFFGAGADVMDNFATRISALFKSITKAVNAFTILEIAIAIGVLAASMWLLSKVPSERLPQIAADLTIVILALSLLAKIMSSTKLFGDKISTFSPKITVFSKLGTILVGLGIVILSLMFFIKAINKIRSEGGNAFAGVALIGMFLGIFALFAAVIKVLGTIGNNSSYKILHGDSFGTDMLKAAGSFALMAIAFRIMIPAIETLADLNKTNPEGLKSAILMFARIMTAFAFVVLAAKRTEKGMGGVGGTFLLMAISLYLLIPVIKSLKKLADENLTNYLWVMGSIIVLIGQFAVAIALLGSLKGGNAAKNGSIAIIAMGVSLLAMAQTMKMIQGIKWANIKTGIFVIAGIVVVLTALGALAGYLAPIGLGMVLVGTALLLFGAGIALVATGALEFARAIDILANSSADAKVVGKNLAAGIGSFFEELNNNMGSILAVVTKIVGAIISVLILKRADIVGVGAGIISSLGKAVGNGLQSNKLLLFAGIAVLFGELLEYLGIRTDVLIDSLVKTVALLMNSIAVAIVDNKDIIIDAIKELFLSIMDVVGELLGQVEDVFGEFIGILTGHKGQSKRPFSQLWDSMITDLFREPDEIREINGRLVKIYSADRASNARQNIETLRKELSENKEILKQEQKEIAKETEKVKAASNTALQGMVDPALAGTEVDKKATLFGAFEGNAIVNGLIDAVKYNPDLDSLFSSLPEGWANGIAENAGLPIESTEELIQSLKEYVTSKAGLDINSPSHVAQEWGKSIPEGVAVGVDENKQLVANEVQSLINDLKKMGEAIGKNFILGFTNGISLYSYLVKAKVQQLGKTVYGTMAEELDINSPSGEGEELGMFFDQGVANGLEKNTYFITKASEILGEETLRSFNAVIQRIKDAIAGDFDMSPVIRPVLDLSEIQNGQMRLGSMLGTNYAFAPNLLNTMGQAANITAATGNVSIRNAQIDATMLEMKTQLADMQAQNRTLTALLNRYLPYIPEVANMQIVTDRGTLVGELAPAMNQKLGKMAAKYRR